MGTTSFLNHPSISVSKNDVVRCALGATDRLDFTRSSCATSSIHQHLRADAPVTHRLHGGKSPWKTEPHTWFSTTKEKYMPTGTVKWFDSDKGFGFIAPDDGSADLFAHYSEIDGRGHRNLEENQKVEFEAEQGQKGPQAKNIRAL